MSLKTREYNKEIKALMSDIKDSVFLPDKRVFAMLRELERLNEPLQDEYLYGYTYHHFARIYSFREDHKNFIKYITKALYYLLRCDDKELLARSYNLFAVEASKNGCLEIAYEYFSIAKSYIDEEDSLVRAMIELNIGATIIQVGDYKQALAYSNKSYRGIRKNKDKEGYYSNLVMALLNLALINLDAGNTEKSKYYLKRIENLDAGDELALWHLVLRCRLAVADSDMEKAQHLVDQICTDIIGGDMFGEITKDLKSLCQELIDKKEYKLVGQLIEEIDRNKHRLFSYEASLFTQIKIDYYKEFKNEEKLLACYEERNAYESKQEKTVNLINFESIQLMNQLVELRREKRRAEEKNLLLQIQAETDALTGLPNRHALNRELESAFDEALSTGRKLGVGIADIDRFKNYNDTYGHQQGDRCLIEVATMLKRVAAKYGLFVARYGGDEFTFIYRNMDDALIRNIEKEITKCGDISLTHGFYSAVPDEQTRIWDYLNRADKELYDIRKKRR